MIEPRASTPSLVDGSAEQVVEALLAASRALMALAARSIAELDADVTLPQFRALVVLATRGPQRVVDISAELGIVSSTGTRLCERLVRKRLVRRTRSTVDRRAVRLTLTPKGRDLVEQVLARRRAELETVVEAIPGPWHSSLVKALTAFAAAAGEVTKEQWWLGWVTPQAQPEDGRAQVRSTHGALPPGAADKEPGCADDATVREEVREE